MNPDSQSRPAPLANTASFPDRPGRRRGGAVAFALVAGLLLGAGGAGLIMSVPAAAPAESPTATNAVPFPPTSVPGLVPLTNMVFVKAGTFTRLKQQVTLTRDFWIGRHEVTQAEFTEVMGLNPSHFTTNRRNPVEKVSFVVATTCCQKLSERERAAGRLPGDYAYRLPTEAEWEYACRAGTTNHFSFGDANTEADAWAWTDENSAGAPHPVGLKRPNPWGLFDMHGNVWEWCSDWFAPYPAGDLTDPVGPASGKFKVFRGGGWNNEAKFARSSNRFMMSPTNGIHFVGFRLALSRVTPATGPTP